MLDVETVKAEVGSAIDLSWVFLNLLGRSFRGYRDLTYSFSGVLALLDCEALYSACWFLFSSLVGTIKLDDEDGARFEEHLLTSITRHVLDEDVLRFPMFTIYCAIGASSGVMDVLYPPSLAMMRQIHPEQVCIKLLVAAGAPRAVHLR